MHAVYHAVYYHYINPAALCLLSAPRPRVTLPGVIIFIPCLPLSLSLFFLLCQRDAEIKTERQQK